MTQPAETETMFGITIEHDEEGRLLTYVQPTGTGDEPGAALILMLDLRHPDCHTHWQQVAALLDQVLLDEMGAAMAAKVSEAAATITPEEMSEVKERVDATMRAQGVEPPDMDLAGGRGDA